MADPIKPGASPAPVATPAAAPAATPASTPAPAAPAAPRAPAPQPKPGARTSKPARPASTVQVTRKPKSLPSAKKALKLDEDVRESVAKESVRQLERYESNSPITARYEEPAQTEEQETPAPVAPAVVASAATAPAPAAAAPAPVEAPEKIKIGDREYTLAELEERMREQEAAPAPSVAEEAPLAPPAPTAEEMAQREADFVAHTTNALEAPLTQEEMDTILGGGKEAVETLAKVRKRDMATAILHARKGIAEGMNPILEKLFTTMKPLVDQQQNIARHNMKTQFATKHKDFVPYMDTCEQVADELIRRFPKQVGQMSPGQFIDEVARQSNVLLSTEHRKWFPHANGDWRKGTVMPQAPAAAPAPQAAAAPAIDPTAPPAPAPSPAAAAAAPAPSANVPQGQARGGKTNWHKQVTANMRG